MIEQNKKGTTETHNQRVNYTILIHAVLYNSILTSLSARGVAQWHRSSFSALSVSLFLFQLLSLPHAFHFSPRDHFSLSPACYLSLSRSLSIPLAIYLSPNHYLSPLLSLLLPLPISLRSSTLYFIQFSTCHLSPRSSLCSLFLTVHVSHLSSLCSLFLTVHVSHLSSLCSLFLTVHVSHLSSLFSLFLTVHVSHLSYLCLLCSLFSLSLPHISIPFSPYLSLFLCLSVCLLVYRSLSLSLFHVRPSPPVSLPSLCTHFLLCLSSPITAIRDIYMYLLAE